MSQLIDAVRRGDLPAVEALLDADPRALGRGDAQGMTPLLWAAFQGDAEVARVLLARGADAGVKDPRGATALMLAAEGGHLAVVRLLVPSGDADARGEALRCAAGAGHLTMVVWLLDEAGVELEYRGTDGRTPLTCAVLGGHAALAEELLRRGAHLEARSSTFLPLENRVDTGWHPLHYAVDRRHPLLVQLLLQAGARVDARTHDGTTPLMLAAWRGDEDSVRLLLRAGADPLLCNARQATALSLSRSHGKPSVTRLLESRVNDWPLAPVLPPSQHPRDRQRH
jgi:ankyrin repeat protein